MKYSFIFLFVFFVLTANSQLQKNSDSIDSSFGQNGKTITALKSGNLDCQDAAKQKNGSIICVGSGGHDSIGGFAILRYSINGILDSSFGIDGISFINFGTSNEIAYAACIQSDDKIVITGSGLINIFDPTYYILTCRLNADGSLDSSFGSKGKIVTDAGGSAYDIALQTDGKIVVTGNDGNGIITLRYLSDGIADKSFGNNGIVATTLTNTTARTNLILSDGKILIGADNFDKLIFVRYNEDGSLDKTFGENGQLYSAVSKHNVGISDMILQPDNKILVTGIQSLFISDSTLLVRYMPDGMIDSSFGKNGIVIADLPYSSVPKRIALGQDLKIVVAGGTGGGTETYQHFLIEEYNSNGAIDSSFNSVGYQILEIQKSDGARGIVIQQNGSIVVTGISKNSQTPSQESIVLIQFSAQVSKKQIIVTKIRHWIQHHYGIEWNQQPNAINYTVQRSSDAIHWLSIHNQSLNISAVPSTYQYEDLVPLPTTNYYRISTTSISGTVINSNVIEASANSDSKVSLFPNPAKNDLRIEGLSAKETKLTVLDFSGTVKLQAIAANTSYNLNIATLKSGNYLLKVEVNDKVVSKKFVKE